MMAEKEYIPREAAIKATCFNCSEKNICSGVCDDTDRLRSIPAADVLPRDEAIKMGAELAAMHGSDATSQQLEEAYLKGVEYGMTRRDVLPVVTCADCKHSEPWYADKSRCFLWHESGIDVFNDGFCNYGEKREER